MHLSPTETAGRFGISIKALRLYESRGLLAPLRSEAGWRTYGPDQSARLHQILALKRLGLPLAKIGELLAGPDALEPVLALQEQVLARDSEQLSRALALVRAARAKLKAGQALSIDDLANLTKETVTMTQPDPEEMKALFSTMARKHFSPEDRALLETRKAHEKVAPASWDALIAEAKTVMARGDSASPAALDVARRWRALVRQFTDGDPGLTSKVRAFWREALQDPKFVAMSSLTPELLDFMIKAQANLPD
jgi:MerR family transcriptional regulator, thiopeptide resistance regulator